MNSRPTAPAKPETNPTEKPRNASRKFDGGAVSCCSLFLNSWAILLTRNSPISSSKYIGLQYWSSHAPSHTAGIDAGTKFRTMSQRML